MSISVYAKGDLITRGGKIYYVDAVTDTELLVLGVSAYNLEVNTHVISIPDTVYAGNIDTLYFYVKLDDMHKLEMCQDTVNYIGKVSDDIVTLIGTEMFHRLYTFKELPISKTRTHSILGIEDLKKYAEDDSIDGEVGTLPVSEDTKKIKHETIKGKDKKVAQKAPAVKMSTEDSVDCILKLLDKGSTQGVLNGTRLVRAGESKNANNTEEPNVKTKETEVKTVTKDSKRTEVKRLHWTSELRRKVLEDLKTKSYKEIASELGISVGNLYNAASQSRKMLQKGII